jgi:hypothetical protein
MTSHSMHICSPIHSCHNASNPYHDFKILHEIPAECQYLLGAVGVRDGGAQHGGKGLDQLRVGRPGGAADVLACMRQRAHASAHAGTRP